MSISEFSIKRPVATMMIIISMVGIGIMTLLNLKTERFPDFNVPVAMISTEWRGASPDDMEKLVTKKIEDAISAVEGITEVNTKSMVGESQVVVEFEHGVDIDGKVNDLVTEVSRIRSDLPKNLTEDPVVKKMDYSGKMVIMASISGKDLIKLKSFAENTVKPRLERIKGVSQIIIAGGYEREILIEVDPDKLEGYGLNISDLYTTVENASLNFPAGYIREGDKEYLVRVLGEAETLEDIRGIVLKNTGGQPLLLTDVTDVRLDVKDLNDYGRTNSKDNILIKVDKSNGGNALDISDTVKKELKKLENQLPDGAVFKINTDTSREIKNSIDSVKNNAITGLILASIVLFVFLRDIRSTLVVALSIPVSVVATFSMFGAKGMSLNIISLMGLSLGVGMLVDNSIVVLDNIFRHLTELNKPRMEAARDGASEMVVPIIASTATTVAVFLPIVFRKGLAREIFHDMSYSIAFSLLASLIIAITFVPMVCSRILSSEKKLDKEGRLLGGLKSIYTRILTVALKNRAATIIITLLLLVGVVGAGVKNIGGEFFPTIDDGIYTVVGEMPKGLDVGKANRISTIYERAVAEHPLTKTYTTTVEKDVVSVAVNIGEPGERDETVFQVVDDIRNQVSWVPDVKLSVVPELAGDAGSKDISLILKSDDVIQMKEYASLIMKRMREVEGLTDFSSSIVGGNPEARLVLDRKKLEYYGINVSDLTLAVSYQILGGAPIKIKTGREELDVTLQLAKKYRESTELLMDARVKTRNGNSVKLSQIAKLEIIEGPASIDKEDRIKKVTLQANNKKGMDLVTAQKKIEQIIEEINLPKSISYSFGGRERICRMLRGSFSLPLW